MEIKNRIKYEYHMHFKCARCGRFRSPFKGYFNVCNECEIEIEKEIKENAKNENRNIERL